MLGNQNVSSGHIMTICTSIFTYGSDRQKSDQVELSDSEPTVEQQQQPLSWSQMDTRSSSAELKKALETL
ncbi:hypothetical protein E3N88_14369 [Mikania micrantha]|uniref:Uncharacterized protein n=1 Tax=Mikania micrantha TaxID=192012 RepID=A0A5N6P1B4_9ASTR|nr:hypothetical protein E3N88_14369 [Mikania micrantha]